VIIPLVKATIVSADTRDRQIIAWRVAILLRVRVLKAIWSVRPNFEGTETLGFEGIPSEKLVDNASDGFTISALIIARLPIRCGTITNVRNTGSINQMLRVL